MTVAELIAKLQSLPDQSVLVVVANGESGDWLIASDIDERAVAPLDWDPEILGKGTIKAVEIV